MIYYLSLGSNADNGVRMIENALRLLDTYGRIRKTSSFYKNEPYGVTDQPAFINTVCIFETHHRPQKLFRKLKQIELQLGRIRTFHWGPRRIDIDIIEWNGEAVDTSVLNIPHPDYKNRDFVLVPLLEIEPGFTSREGITLPDMIDSCNRSHRLDAMDTAHEF